MSMTATIQRGTAETYDTPASFVAHLPNVQCRYWEEAVADAERTAPSGDVRLLKLATMIVLPGTDVAARDRITSVLDAGGVEQLARPMAIDGDPINLGAFLQLSLSSVS